MGCGGCGFHTRLIRIVATAILLCLITRGDADLRSQHNGLFDTVDRFNCECRRIHRFT